MSQNTVNPTMVAGWLLADLFLVLFLVAWGTDPTVAPSSPSPTPPSTSPAPLPTVSPRPAPSPDPEPTSPPGLAKEPGLLGFTLSTTSGGALRNPDEVSAAVAGLSGSDHPRAGMVLVWGHSPDVGAGMHLAEQVAQLLPAANPHVFGDATMRGLWKGDSATGTVELEIYYLTG